MRINVRDEELRGILSQGEIELGQLLTNLLLSGVEVAADNNRCMFVDLPD